METALKKYVCLNQWGFFIEFTGIKNIKTNLIIICKIGLRDALD